MLLQDKAALQLSAHVPLPLEEIRKLLELPANAQHGDVAFPCFALAKTLRKSPAAIAAELSQALQAEDVGAAVEAVGPYLNFKFERGAAASELMAEFAQPQFGRADIGRGMRVVIDMSSPNIAKPFGMGHLRSTMIGNAIGNILRRVGYEVVKVNHLGDWGTQFGKMIVAYLKWGEPQRIAQHPIWAYLELYVKFHDEAAAHPELEDEARAWFHKLEAGDEQALQLWRQFVADSLEEFKKLYARLGVEFDEYLGESFYNDKMDAIVSLLAAKDLLELSDGARVVRLDDLGMPPCLIVKSDGASIYGARDLATAMYRHDVMRAERLLYVVGAEQTLHFRQVFAVLEKLGLEWAQECKHIPFGLMRIEGRKMSTRKGKVVFLEEVLNEAARQAAKAVEEKNPGLSGKAEVAEQVGIGAVVFGDLKNTRTLEVDFTLAEVLNFDGETGPYLQYTYARTQSLLDKASRMPGGEASPDFRFLSGDHAWQLLTTVALYPHSLALAAERYEPSVLARYLIDLAQAFNRFYHHERVLVEQGAERGARIALTGAVADCLQQGLALLGLQTPREI